LKGSSEKDVWLKPYVSVVVCHYTTGSGCSGTFPQRVIELKCGRQQRRRPAVAKLYFLLKHPVMLA